MLVLMALVLVMSAASPAAANVPSPADSDVPGFIPVVGTRAAPADPTPDPAGACRIVIRDFVHNPIRNSLVQLDFSACTDTKLCEAVVNGQTVDCRFGSVGGLTDIDGVVTFYVLGAGLNDGAGTVTPAGAGCVKVYADGVLMNWSSGSTAVLYDQNGALPGSANDGVNEDDLALSTLDVLETMQGMRPFRGRSAYASRGYLSALDLAYHKEILMRSLAGQGSGTGCADGSGIRSYCP